MVVSTEDRQNDAKTGCGPGRRGLERRGEKSPKLEVLEGKEKKRFRKPEAIGWLRAEELGEERWEQFQRCQ